MLNNSDIYTELPKEAVDKIREFIDENNWFVKNEQIEHPVAEKIFDIVDEYCKVIYYPIEDAKEENDGFLLTNMPLKNGETVSIIFINTYQTQEKQVFVAAHEFGHYVKVGEYVRKACGKDYNEEKIVNRFAAEFLMPEDIFLEYIYEERKIDSLVTYGDVIETAVEVMKKFAVPYTAVILRMWETGIIDLSDARGLIDGKDWISKDSIRKIVETIKCSADFEAERPSGKKRYISGLAELLDNAEERENISQAKVDRLRDEFAIVKEKDSIMLETISLKQGKR